MTRVIGVLLAASVLLLAGCSTALPAGSGASVPASDLPTSPTPTTAATSSAPTAADPTCETLIVAQTVADFQDLGWTATQEPFMIGATEIDGGLTCKWSEPGGTGEGLQIFGWAPISQTDSQRAQAELLANGWQRIDNDEGTFVTENADTAFATGTEGYGLTYEFGDGWVTFADTKQSLLLIVRPAL